MYEFEKLDVYRKSMDFTDRIYTITRDFPKEEMYGIISQLRRAALSIGLNIAEGKGRFHSKVFVQFLYQSRGSLYEAIALLQMSGRLGYLGAQETEDMLGMAAEISKMLSGLINAIEKRK